MWSASLLLILVIRSRHLPLDFPFPPSSVAEFSPPSLPSPPRLPSPLDLTSSPPVTPGWRAQSPSSSPGFQPSSLFFKDAVPGLLASVVFKENVPSSLSLSLWMHCHFPLGCFYCFSLSLVWSCLIMTGPSVVLFAFLALAFCWDSWICRLIVFVFLFWKIFVIISSELFLSSLYLLSLGDFYYMYVRSCSSNSGMLNSFFFSNLFSLCVSFCIVSISLT